MNFTEFKNLVVSACEKAGITEYELYYQTAESTSVGVFQHEVSEFTASEEGGVCFRCILNGKMGYAATENLSEGEASAIVARAADNAATLEAEEAVFLGRGGQRYEPFEAKSYELPTTEALIAAALDTQEKLYAADPCVVDGCQTEAVKLGRRIAIYNSLGLDLQYDHSLCALIAAAVVSDGQEMANDYQVGKGALSQIDAQALAEKAAKDAKLQLGGDVAPTGQYPVVFDPAAMASLLSTYGSIFSAEAAQKGLSKLAGREGTLIAAPCVTLVDDPFYPGSAMPLPFDAEGSPTHKKNIIEQGVLRTLLHNLKTAHKAGVATTGNGHKGSYTAPVGIAPFTMYLAPGQLTEEELLAQAGEGVYITSLGGLHAGADPISGDFSLQSAGFMIRGGKKREYVKSFAVAGNFYELLKTIRATADSCKLEPFALGSTAFGAPATLVDGLSIAGK